MIPTWLQRQRGETTRAAAIRLCPRCKAPTLVGLDADTCALTVRVDPTPINQKGEAVAAFSRRTTYDLTGDGRRKQLDPRRPDHIRRSRRYPVFAQHECGHDLSQFAVESPTPKKETVSDVPPF